MCLAKAFIRRDDGDEVVMANVATVEVSEESIALTTIFGERVALDARVEFIDFANGSIKFRPFENVQAMVDFTKEYGAY